MKNNPDYHCNGSKKPHPYSIIYVSSPRNLPNGLLEVREIAVCTNCLEHNISRNLPVNAQPYTHIIDPCDPKHPIPRVDEPTRQKFESYAHISIVEIAKEVEIHSKMPRPRLEISSTSRKGPDKSWFGPGERLYNHHKKYQKLSSKVEIPSKPTEFD